MLHKLSLSALVVVLIAALAAPGVLLAQDDAGFPVPPGRLIIGDENGLYSLLADGSEKTYLVEEDEANCWLRDGLLSPDGGQMLYTRICGGTSPTDWHAEGRTASIFLLELASGQSTEVVANDGSYQDYAGAWHPDGTSFVIYSNRSNDRYNLFLVEGGETAQITDFDTDVGRVSWHPDGRYLIYNRYQVADNSWDIRAWDLESRTEKSVVPGLTPHFSPDGEWIVYATTGAAGADVFIMPAACIFSEAECDAATTATNITYTPDIAEREPLWSPDQSQIVYLRDTNPEATTTTWDVYRQEIRTGLQQNLTVSSDIKERTTDWERVAGAERVAVESVLPVVMRLTSSTANLREQPNTTSNVLGVLTGGQLLFVQGANAARDWYLITLPEDGATAWLFANLAAEVQGDPASVPEISAE
ncbi:MAG: SH3 domain-containing protein [Chloroflexi bacterium]|nr:SH3 domain-containing protein [Chloroflexota bacterium]